MRTSKYPLRMRKPFSYNLTVEGAMDAGRQFDPLVQLTPRIIALLTERGIKVSAHVANLNIVEQANDAVYRVLTWFTLDIEGKTCWWFVAVKPDKLDSLIGRLRTQGEPFIDFEPYGELLSVGWGKRPDDDTGYKSSRDF